MPDPPTPPEKPLMNDESRVIWKYAVEDARKGFMTVDSRMIVRVDEELQYLRARITELEAADQRLLRIESMVCQLVNHFRNAAG